MGFFGKLKKGIKGIGKLAKKAAPALAFIPGVGLPLAAGIGAAGGLLGGGGLRGAAEGAAGGALGDFAQGAIKRIPGIGGLGGQEGGGFGGAVRGIGGFLKDNPALALGGVEAFMNAQDATRQRGLQDEQIEAARAAQARRQQLEDEILAGLGNRQSFDFSDTFADPSNPFFQPSVNTGVSALPPSVQTSIPSGDPGVFGPGGQPSFGPSPLPFAPGNPRPPVAPPPTGFDLGGIDPRLIRGLSPEFRRT